ncbi:MAG: hypothetical protein F6K28_01360 [Microcoleus sp. SIO2G3]|nr:hypothetical protein [Microcoleus sp. SIO2G3]
MSDRRSKDTSGQQQMQLPVLLQALNTLLLTIEKQLHLDRSQSNPHPSGV